MSDNPTLFPDSVTINGINVPDVSVDMIRPSLADVGSKTGDRIESVGTPKLPAGYHIRTYRSGDEQTWLNIIGNAEEFFAVEDDLFERQFGDQAEQLDDRMFFIDWTAPDGQVSTVATASAWWKTAWMVEDKSQGETVDRGEWAQVHWVAVEPSHQGRGLTKPIMGRVMQRMAQSHNRAMLGTSTARVWALKVYLDFGFVPDEVGLVDPVVKNAWSQVQKVLMHPLLKPTFG